MASSSRPPPVRSALAGGVRDNLRVPKLGHVVADRLRQRMADGQLGSGDRLPPESEMLTELGISRPTLREALRVLESEGLIAVGRGTRTGAHVLGPSIARVAQYANLMLVANKATLLHIQEVRLMLEPPIAAALARRASRKSVIEGLRKVLLKGSEALEAGRYVGAVEANNEFHEQLVSSTNNPVLLLLIGMLHDMSAKGYAAVLMGDNASAHDALRRNIGKSIAGAQRLTDFIADGKAPEAEAFWRKYMERTLVFLERTGLGARRIRYEAIGSP